MQSLSSLRLKKSQSGVYKLFDSQKNLIYIGKSYNLRQRIKATTRFRLQAKYVSIMLTSYKVETDLLEVKLIKKYLPQINREVIPHNKFIANNCDSINIQENFSELIYIDTEQKLKLCFGYLIKYFNSDKITLFCYFPPSKDELTQLPDKVIVDEIIYLKHKRVDRNKELKNYFYEEVK